ncbi:DUF5819 family protein [Streptomyces sp. NPDC058751]|uniref:DUF5819 family protein n=1 Tax=Streptomyces sp. NPDC058751 TaxID=3346623 RepID=UPI0036C72FB3
MTGTEEVVSSESGAIGADVVASVESGATGPEAAASAESETAGPDAVVLPGPGTSGAGAVSRPEPEVTGPVAGAGEEDAGVSEVSGPAGSEAVTLPERVEAVSQKAAPAGLDGAGSGATAAPEHPGEAARPKDAAPVGLAALSLGPQIVAALALALVAVGACVHLGMVFLHVSPSNTVTKQHGRAIDEWIYPEFEQNWKLFAPNPLQQDIAVQVRAMVRTEDGISQETGWYGLSALDGRAIDGNPLPSHTQQNELRRAWDFYVATHEDENRPVGLRGDLAERYLRRIGVLRLDREHAGGEGAVVERVQFRSLTTDVPPPRWSDEKVSDRPVVRELPWWSVPGSDRADGLTEASAR